ncbi:MAG TPA: NAD(+) synthase [Devosiaceae bacterium]|jgi:NAD+ synthase (glutamine-hydrolysing)|nr:NAD(+) synthase [Devosiaceae bacterium]
MNAVPESFRSIYSQGFCRVAVCTPHTAIADPALNASRTLELAREASARHAVVAVFPEMGLASYTSDDLFFQDAVLDGVERAIAELTEASRTLEPALLVGAPLRRGEALYNCAVVICRGEIAGVVPKTYLPNYREFYEKRYFASGGDVRGGTIRLLGQDVPFGTDLVFEAAAIPGLRLHVEICEDFWSPLPPSTIGALAGATVLANLSASNITIGKADFRRLLCQSQAGRAIAAYLYSGAGRGESTTDLAWDGHGMIVENGDVLAETERFSREPGVIFADIDLERLLQDRRRQTSFADTAKLWRAQVEAMRHVPLPLVRPEGEVPLERRVERFPYVPSNPATRDERCAEVYSIQVAGLAQRLEATGIRKAVIGVSGGLDSTQALIVLAKCFDRLGWPRSDILAYSMPGFATGSKTRDNARRLMQALGVTAQEIDIRPSARQMLADLGHPYDRGEKLYDITFENVQAGERTSHLFRLANLHNGLVIGTSDLSEIALGWSTYGVGDQMAHYQINASVPKTLIRHLMRWMIDTRQFDQPALDAIESVLSTEISPELVPGASEDDIQRTEDFIGPYPLQDFNLYYLSRFGFRPSRVAYLSLHAWGDRNRGEWPDNLPEKEHVDYDLATIARWMEVFIQRFFATSQFKRSAIPNGPKVGSGGSLSPRGDWRAPSDGSAAAWLAELRGALGTVGPASPKRRKTRSRG